MKSIKLLLLSFFILMVIGCDDHAHEHEGLDHGHSHDNNPSQTTSNKHDSID